MVTEQYLDSIKEIVVENVEKDKKNPTAENYQKEFNKHFECDFLYFEHVFDFLKDNYAHMERDDKLMESLRNKIREYLSNAARLYIKYNMKKEN